MHPFTSTILQWYRHNHRNLPWKNTQDVYKIWLSEIMLQQTKIEQMLTYYSRFVNTFPSLKSLANATEDQVLKIWEGLGYYTRARNLHHTAKYVVTHLNGKFPDRYEELIKLKGIGEYTAAAIASFAYQQPYPVVDGNVNRLITRYFGIQKSIKLLKVKKLIYAKANMLLDRDNPATYNQAILDYGALHCTSQKPNCTNCLLSNTCIAFAKQLVDKIPNIPKKLKHKTRYFTYLLVHDNKYCYVLKRTNNDIWKNLYELLLIETKKKLSKQAIFNTLDSNSLIGNNQYKLISTFQKKHILSHQILHITFFQMEVNTLLETKNYSKMMLTDLNIYPFPIVIKNYLQKIFPHTQS